VGFRIARGKNGTVINAGKRTLVQFFPLTRISSDWEARSKFLIFEFGFLITLIAGAQSQTGASIKNRNFRPPDAAKGTSYSG